MMYTITSSGLKPCEKFDVTVGRTYYMGASSSPNLVHILDVTPSRITYAHTYKETARTEDRRIVESLIAEGCATIKNRRKALGPSAPVWQVKGQDIYEARIGASVPSWHFDRHTVLVRPMKGDPMSDANWCAAEEYGNVGGIDDMLEIECSGESLTNLHSDQRLYIVSGICTHRAPLTRNEEKAIERSAAEESARRSA